MKTANAKQLDKMWKYFGPLFILFLALDQVSKWWVVNNLEAGRMKEFGLVLSYNDGVVFGIDLPLWGIYLMTIAVLGLLTFLVIEYKLWRDHLHLFAVALLFAGALGNLIDRIRFSYVIDFIKVYWWPTFNLADVFLVMAVALLAWEFFIREDTVSNI